MIAMLSVAVGLAIVAMVVLTALMGWGGPTNRVQRVSLCVMAAGLAWAGPARLFGQPPGLGDLMFVGGIAVHLATVYGPRIWRRAAALDGVDDGRIDFSARSPRTAGTCPPEPRPAPRPTRRQG